MSGSISNTFITPQQVTKRAIPMFVNTNAFLKNVDRQYSDQFAREGGKIGSTLQIRTPTDYVVSSGPTLAPQAIVEQFTSLTVSNQKHVDLVITSADMALRVEEFDELILKPAVNRLAGYVSADLMSLVNTIPNISGNISSGTVSIPTTRTWAGAKAVLMQNSTPNMDLMAVIEPLAMANAQQQIQGLFNPTGRISEAFDSGMVQGPALGIAKWMDDQLVPFYTTGGTTGLTVSGANQTGTTITLSAATTSFKVGDLVTFAGVNQVNRVSHTVLTGQLRTFVITGTGTNTISIYPALTPLAGGDVAFATVDVSPASAAAVNLVLNASQTITKNFVMHPKAFTLATVDMPTWDKGVVNAHREVFDGISMRALSTYYPQTDQMIMRLDILYGYAAIRPEWAVLVPDLT